MRVNKEETAGFGRRFSEIFNEKRSSAYELGALIGKTAPTIYRWLAGESIPGDSEIRELCGMFGVNFKWLKLGKGEKEAPKETKPHFYSFAPLNEHEIKLVEMFRKLPTLERKNHAINALSEMIKMFVNNNENKENIENERHGLENEPHEEKQRDRD